MANNNFIKHYLLSDEEVANLNRKFGQFIMTKSGSMYIDTDDERIQLGGGGGSSPGNSYTKAEVNALIAELENEISAAISGLEWKPAVETFADIATIYPTPADGWTVNTKDKDETYRYTGTEWVLISANSIPIATIDLDGLLSKEDKTRIDSLSTEVLSKISESEDGNLLFNGEEIKGGGGGITELPIATTETLGGVIVGDGLSVDETGVLSALGGGGSNTEIKSYTYTGTGSYGEDNPTILEFESKPEWVLVYGTATSTNNMTRSFFTVESPVFYTEVYNNGASQKGTGSGLLRWSEDYKSVNMMLKAGSDAHSQFNYPDTEYTVIYATLGGGGEPAQTIYIENTVTHSTVPFTKIIATTTELVDGVSSLEDGVLYLVYEAD